MLIGTRRGQAPPISAMACPACCFCAQLNRGSVPTAYLPTTTAARYGLALDYDPVTHAAKGLLCEPAATNLLLRSQRVRQCELGRRSVRRSRRMPSTAPNGSAGGGCLYPRQRASQCRLAHRVHRHRGGRHGCIRFSVYVKNGTLGNNWLRLNLISYRRHGGLGSIWQRARRERRSGSPTSYDDYERREWLVSRSI